MIKEFKGEYRWLSNFAPVNIIRNCRSYPSVEHAFQSAKAHDPAWKMFCVQIEDPRAVKKASRYVKLVSNWEEIKVGVMRRCLRQKFGQEPYRSKLKATGDKHIQEGNWWGDQFWGVCLKTDSGQNMLGELIMEIRKEIQA